jgi:hypothetical protein
MMGLRKQKFRVISEAIGVFDLIRSESGDKHRAVEKCAHRGLACSAKALRSDFTAAATSIVRVDEKIPL